MAENQPEIPSTAQVWAWLKAKVMPILIGIGILLYVLADFWSCVDEAVIVENPSWHGAPLCGTTNKHDRRETDRGQMVTYLGQGSPDYIDRCFREKWPQASLRYLRTGYDDNLRQPIAIYEGRDGTLFGYGIHRSPNGSGDLVVNVYRYQP